MLKKLIYSISVTVPLCFSALLQGGISDFGDYTVANYSVQEQYKDLNDLKEQLGDDIVESEVVVAFDFTGSNHKTGVGSFGKRSLHADLGTGKHNPYEVVGTTLGGILNIMDSDGIFDAIAFGDEKSVGSDYMKNSVTAIKTKDGRDPKGYKELMAAYKLYAKTAQMSGPTNFSAPIRHAADYAKRIGKHTVLLIITDGALTTDGTRLPNGKVVNCETETLEAIAYAAREAPLSIIVVGVGDGTKFDSSKNPDDVGSFEELEILDDLLDPNINKSRMPYAKYNSKDMIAGDIVQFVNATQFFEKHKSKSRLKVQKAFTLKALQEIPEQREEMVNRGLLSQ